MDPFCVEFQFNYEEWVRVIMVEFLNLVTETDIMLMGNSLKGIQRPKLCQWVIVSKEKKLTRGL